jgi:hypothetical protein
VADVLLRIMQEETNHIFWKKVKKIENIEILCNLGLMNGRFCESDRVVGGIWNFDRYVKVCERSRGKMYENLINALLISAKGFCWDWN